MSAKTRFSRHSAAATNPGAMWPPIRNAHDPMAGPIMKAAPEAAESQPSTCARRSGAVVSATYAWATAIVPPEAPCTRREMNSTVTVVASPNRT